MTALDGQLLLADILGAISLHLPIIIFKCAFLTPIIGLHYILNPQKLEKVIKAMIIKAMMNAIESTITLHFEIT